MAKEFQRSMVWFRRDLRLRDHRALWNASRRSHDIVGVFVFDTHILSKLPRHDQRVTFLVEALKSLQEDLQSRNAQIIVLHGDPIREIPKAVQKLKVQALFFNEDFESYAIQRDSKVIQKLQSENIPVHTFCDHILLGSRIKKKDGTPYQVFTPYAKQWKEVLSKNDFKLCPIPQNWARIKTDPSPWKRLKFDLTPNSWRASEASAQQCLRKFKKHLATYHETRNYPALSSGTSRLSPYLRFGQLSPRQCLQLAVSSSSEGAQVWLNELIWRDFFHMILHCFPHVEFHAFKRRYDSIAWSEREDHFQAWCEGKTGYPLIDAAMNQLNQTGWMHNRLRMVVASFLTKDLLIDWKKGEHYFAQKLMDYDLASNNGGWQWAASTGCDAQPYFRIFNPLSQSKKFDPEGAFIRKWVPSLAKRPAKDIHSLKKMDGYPDPIVDHATQRAKALQLFKNIQ